MLGHGGRPHSEQRMAHEVNASTGYGRVRLRFCGSWIRPRDTLATAASDIIENEGGLLARGGLSVGRREAPNVRSR